jgi:hypothetical protein
MKTISQERARQAHWGRRALLILVIGLLLAAAVWLGVELYGEAIDPPAADLPVDVQG